MDIAPIDYLLADHTTGREIARASVVAVYQDGSVAVAGVGDDDVRCDVLLTPGGTPQPLVPGQPVLVWHSGRQGQRGVILGRIGGAVRAEAASHGVAHPPLATSLPVARDLEDEIPESIVLEAKHALTLRVGDGSITLRADGKILIKGRDLVSSAQRSNRIKGGAVSIN